jgi:hypothetical protein
MRPIPSDRVNKILVAITLGRDKDEVVQDEDEADLWDELAEEVAQTKEAGGMVWPPSE